MGLKFLLALYSNVIFCYIKSLIVFQLISPTLSRFPCKDLLVCHFGIRVVVAIIDKLVENGC